MNALLACYDSDDEEELGALIYKSSLTGKTIAAAGEDKEAKSQSAAATLATKKTKKKTSNKRDRHTHQPSSADKVKSSSPIARGTKRPAVDGATYGGDGNDAEDVKNQKHRALDVSAAATNISISDSQTRHLHNMRAKDIKPRLKAGREVYAAWWPDEDKTGSPSWYPGTIKSYRKVKRGSGSERKNYSYGSLRLYDLEYDDGDELDGVEDKYIFTKEDYLLHMRHNKEGGRDWIGVKNVVDPESSDGWASSVGWYNTTMIDGREQSFSFLSDALRAYDASVGHTEISQSKKMSKLNLPEELLFDNDDDLGVDRPTRKILMWIRNNMSRKRQRKKVVSGLRVKVRFDDSAWYGGSITNVMNKGREVEIAFDDGSTEVANFPDRDIIVDDKNNGGHSVSASAFIPLLNFNHSRHLNVRDDGMAKVGSLTNNDAPRSPRISRKRQRKVLKA